MTIPSRLHRILKAKLLRHVGRPAEPETWRDEEPPPQADAWRAATESPDSLRQEWLAILELPSDASGDEIRSAYHKLCKRYHPDLFAGQPEKAKLAGELMSEINLAYRKLTRA